MPTKLPKAWESWRSIPEKDPKRLVKLIEQAIKARNTRKDLEAQAEALARTEREIKDHLINSFGKAELEVVKTKLGTARLVAKDVPQIDPEDTGAWTKFYAYVAKHAAWELLQKRFGERACVERWEAGESIPGVIKFHKLEVKLED